MKNALLLIFILLCLGQTSVLRLEEDENLRYYDENKVLITQLNLPKGTVISVPDNSTPKSKTFRKDDGSTGNASYYGQIKVISLPPDHGLTAVEIESLYLQKKAQTNFFLFRNIVDRAKKLTSQTDALLELKEGGRLFLDYRPYVIDAELERKLKEAALGANTENCSEYVPPDVSKLPLEAAVPEMAFGVEVASYSVSPEVNQLIKIAKRRRLGKSDGSCYEYVKKALEKAGFLSFYPDTSAVKLAGMNGAQFETKSLDGTQSTITFDSTHGESAKHGLHLLTNLESIVEALTDEDSTHPEISTLTQRDLLPAKPWQNKNFVNLLDGPEKDLIKRPSDAPRGAILVYDRPGDPAAHGDVQIKVGHSGEGGYVSDFSTPNSYTSNDQLTSGCEGNPIPLDCKRLIAVLVRKDL